MNVYLRMNVYLPALCRRLFALATVVATGNALMVAPVSAQQTVTQEFCNTTPITVPATSGPARGSPYPSPISVGGLGDVISVTATLKDINHQRPNHLDILLSAPTPSRNLVVYSDSGRFGSAVGVTVTLDDSAAASLPSGPVSSGTYRPTNIADTGGTESYPGPAPAPSGATTFSTFAGTPGSGTWNLWVVDDSLGEAGSLSGGWCLKVTAVLPPPPTVTVEQAASQTDPAEVSPIVFDIVFSEAVTGLTGADFVVGGTAGGNKAVTVSGSGTSYTASVAGMTTPGSVVLTLPADRAATQTGTGNAASTSTDNTVEWLPPAPAVTVEQDPAQSDPALVGPIVFDVQFSEPVTGLSAAGLTTFGSTAGGTLVASLSGSGASYRVEVTGMTTTGTVVLTVLADSAFSVADGEGNTRSTSNDNEVTFALPLTVTVIQAAGQTDPAEVSPIGFDIVFSEAVTGLIGADFVVGGIAGGNKVVTVTGSGTTYTASVAGMTTPGSVVLILPAGGAASSISGVANVASTSTDNTVEWLPPAPAVTVEQDPGQADPAVAGPIVFDVQFSEPVTGLTVSSLTTLGSTAGGTLVASLSGSGASYRVEVTGMTTAGTVVLTVLADSAFSVADGEGNTRSTSTDNTVTFALPPAAVTPQKVPALNAWGLPALAGLLGIAALLTLRRRLMV